MSKKTRVGDIAAQIRGVTYSKSEATSKPNEGYLPILRAMNITDHGLNFDDLVFVPKSSVSERQMLNVGDIVVAASSGSLEVVGKASVVTAPVIASFGAFCKVVRPGPDIYPSYLGHYFRTPEYRSIISRLAQGANINNLKNEHIDDLEIPLPPLDEQKRIAAVLDKADALRRQSQESLQLTEKLLQSVFIDMFGDPGRNPRGWPVVKSSELYADKPRLGTMKPAKGEGNLVVRVGELGKEAVAFDKCGRVELQHEDIHRFKLLPGDTLLARAIGSQAQLGKCSYFDGHPETVVADSHVMRLRPDPIKCDPYWFYSLLAAPFGRKLIQAKGGATAVQFNINGAQASDLNIPLPPRHLQTSFVQIAKRLKAQAQDQELSGKQAERLFGSLQQRAFRGELDLSRLTSFAS